MPDTFTPEQISQILEEFFKVVGTRQYIGARYVPLFGRKDEDSIEWDNTKPYEPLTIVLYQGNSYTSRQFVPVGVEITNQEFWAITGNYNAQVEQYRRETAAVREVADAAKTDIDTLLPKADFSAGNTVKKYVDDSVAQVAEILPSDDFSSKNTVKKYVDGSVAIVQTDIDTLLPKADFSAENTVKKYIDDSIAKLSVKTPYKLISKYIKTINCYIHEVIIPRTSINLPYLAIRDNNYQYACEYAINKENAFLINGSLGTPRISNGIIDGSNRGTNPEGWYIMGFDASGNPMITPDINFSATGTGLLAQGYVCAFPVWSPIVLNNRPYDYASEIPSSAANFEYIFNQKHPRSIFGWDNDNFYLVAAEGRIPYSAGIDFSQLVELCQLLGIQNAMNMDGGGSTQLWCTNPAMNLVYSRDVSVSQTPNVPYNSRNVQALIVFDRKEV